MEKHAGTFMTIFGVLFPDGYDYDAGFIANIDKSKESDGKIFLKIHALTQKFESS